MAEHQTLCHSCFTPVHPLASRCPHCLAELGMGGSPRSGRSNTPVSSDVDLGVTLFLVGVILASGLLVLAKLF